MSWKTFFSHYRYVMASMDFKVVFDFRARPLFILNIIDHDLRHSIASFLINGGRSLYEVQKILGHTQVKTTQRYAHLSQDSLISAANTAMKSVPLLQLMPKQVGDVMLLAAKAG